MSGVVVKVFDGRRLMWLSGVLSVLVFVGGARAADDTDSWIGRLADEATRDQARDKLRDRGAAAVEPLVKALRHANPVIRSESSFVLGRIRSKRAVPPLIDTLKDDEAQVRSKAAYALGEIADARAIDALVERLTDPAAEVRANACFALGQIGKPEPARDLVRALLDKDESVRNYAAQALGFCGEPKALPALAWTALHDKSPYVRALAISGLGAQKDPRTCGVLLVLLESDEYLVRARAIEALLEITGSRRGYDPRVSEARRAPALTRWKNWYGQNFRTLGTLDVQGPLRTYEWWNGEPKPIPEPQPEPKPGPQPEPTPQPRPPVTEELLGAPDTRLGTPVDLVEERSTDLSRQGLNVEAAAFFRSGQEHLQAGRHREAVEAFQACVKLADDWTDAYLKLALCHQKLNQLEQAAAEYRRCLQIDPSDAPAANGLAGVCERLDRTDDAETFYRLALQADPRSAVVRFNLAGLLFRTDRKPQARPFYEELLKIEPLPSGVSPAVVRLRLAACLDEAGETDEAVKLLNEVCEMSKDAGVLHEAAKRFLRMSRSEEVKSVLERAYEVSGGGVESAYLLAVFLLRAPDEKMRDVKRATVCAEAAVTADPANPDYASLLAEAAHAAGDMRHAVTLAESALKLAPDSPRLRKQLEDYQKELAAQEKTKPPEEEKEKEKEKEEPVPAPPEARVP